jgi:bifunctional non-homologous end joining protein LigD
MARSSKSRNPEPAFVTPMAAQLVPELPEGEAWLYEVKWDGYRALILKTGDQVKIRSRNDNDFTLKFPSIARAATGLKADRLALDGEIVALAPNGRPSFQALQHGAQIGYQIAFYTFDVLHLDGTDLGGRPLTERRRALLA